MQLRMTDIWGKKSASTRSKTPAKHQRSKTPAKRRRSETPAEHRRSETPAKRRRSETQERSSQKKARKTARTLASPSREIPKKAPRVVLNLSDDSDCGDADAGMSDHESGDSDTEEEVDEACPRKRTIEFSGRSFSHGAPDKENSREFVNQSSAGERDADAAVSGSSPTWGDSHSMRVPSDSEGADGTEKPRLSLADADGSKNSMSALNGADVTGKRERGTRLDSPSPDRRRRPLSPSGAFSPSSALKSSAKHRKRPISTRKTSDVMSDTPPRTTTQSRFSLQSGDENDQSDALRSQSPTPTTKRRQSAFSLLDSPPSPRSPAECHSPSQPECHSPSKQMASNDEHQRKRRKRRKLSLSAKKSSVSPSIPAAKASTPSRSLFPRPLFPSVAPQGGPKKRLSFTNSAASKSSLGEPSRESDRSTASLTPASSPGRPADSVFRPASSFISDHNDTAAPITPISESSKHVVRSPTFVSSSCSKTPSARSPSSSSTPAGSSSPGTPAGRRGISYRPFDIDDFGFMSEAEKRAKAKAEGRIPENEDAPLVSSSSAADEADALFPYSQGDVSASQSDATSRSNVSTFAQSFYSSASTSAAPSSSQSEYPVLSPDSQDFDFDASPSQPPPPPEEPKRFRTPAEVRASFRAKSRGMKAAYRNTTPKPSSGSSKSSGFRAPAPKSAPGASKSSSAFSQSNSPQNATGSGSSTASPSRPKRALSFLANGAETAYKPSVFSAHRDFGYLRNDEKIENSNSQAYVAPFKRRIDLKKEGGGGGGWRKAGAPGGGRKPAASTGGWWSKTHNRGFGGGLLQNERLNIKFAMANLSPEMRAEMERREMEDSEKRLAEFHNREIPQNVDDEAPSVADMHKRMSPFFLAILRGIANRLEGLPDDISTQWVIGNFSCKLSEVLNAYKAKIERIDFRPPNVSRDHLHIRGVLATVRWKYVCADDQLAVLRLDAQLSAEVDAYVSAHANLRRNVPYYYAFNFVKRSPDLVAKSMLPYALVTHPYWLKNKKNHPVEVSSNRSAWNTRA